MEPDFKDFKILTKGETLQHFIIRIGVDSGGFLTYDCLQNMTIYDLLKTGEYLYDILIKKKKML